MPKPISPLSDTKIKKAKPQDKAYTLFDGGGLFLLVTPSGSKLWRLKYRFQKNGKLLALGQYPDVTLSDAREARHTARQQLAQGIDPAAARKANKNIIQDGTFEAVALEWHGKFTPRWSPKHAATTLTRLEQDLFPLMGERPIVDIKAPELLAALRRVESRGALESAHRLRSIAGQVFRYAVATGRAERDCSGDLRGALPQPEKKHHAAIIEPKDVAPLLRACDTYQGGFVVRCALQLAPLFFVRPGELRQAEWQEIDLDEAVWNIPAHKMKKKAPHIVPLCVQAVEILTKLKQYTGMGQYVFPSRYSILNPMSVNAINHALRRMGYDKDTMSTHGFRAMARTILDEVLKVRPEYIEHQLAHKVQDPLGRAYNRTTYLPERREMMQLWADYLDGLKKGASVVPICKKVQP